LSRPPVRRCWYDVDAAALYAASIGCRHDTGQVRLDIVWLTVHHELPVLVAACRAEFARAPDP
jgi:hypothetical protein